MNVCTPPSLRTRGVFHDDTVVVDFPPSFQTHHASSDTLFAARQRQLVHTTLLCSETARLRFPVLEVAFGGFFTRVDRRFQSGFGGRSPLRRSRSSLLGPQPERQPPRSTEPPTVTPAVAASTVITSPNAPHDFPPPVVTGFSSPPRSSRPYSPLRARLRLRPACSLSCGPLPGLSWPLPCWPSAPARLGLGLTGLGHSLLRATR